jgi:farnesyl-diphosphate farnesyltransferase
MGSGMADYTIRASTSGKVFLTSLEDYDLYCHYAAGVVGEGVSRIFSASAKESPILATQLELSNSISMLLQKTNIIRDVREDADEGRHWWPLVVLQEFEFTTTRDMLDAIDSSPSNDLSSLSNEAKKALHAQTAMIADALRHATDALDFMRLLKNRSVFNFYAIPTVMAMATLALFVNNAEVFRRLVKIRKAEAAFVGSYELF